MKNILVIAAVGIATISSAHATTEAGQFVFFAKYNFSKVAFGKPVKSVMIHTGVLVQPGCSSSSGAYWDNVQDKVMFDAVDHFQAEDVKFVTRANECNSVKGVIVQYWVTFTDSSTLQTNPAMVPVATTLDAGSDPNTRTNLEQEARSALGAGIGGNQTTSVRVNEDFAD